MTRTRLLAAYDRLCAAQAHKQALMPERMRTLQTDPEFTRAVSSESAARDDFHATALAYCQRFRRETHAEEALQERPRPQR